MCLFAVRLCSVLLPAVCQLRYCHDTTTHGFKSTPRTFFLKPIQDPLIWFKDLVVYFGFTWGFYFLADCYRSSKFCAVGLPERRWQEHPNPPPPPPPPHLGHKPQASCIHKEAITTASQLSAPEHTSDTNISMKEGANGVQRKAR